MVYNSIMKVDVDARKLMYSNIILAGGTSLLLVHICLIISFMWLLKNCKALQCSLALPIVFKRNLRL